MKRKVIAIALSLALLSSLFVFAVPASATPPQTLSGNFSGPGAVITDVRFANGNMFMIYTSVHTLTGDIEGDIVSQGSGVLHPNGEWNMASTGTFTGSFNGAEGTADYVLNLRGPMPLYSGKMIFSGGTGELANLHAVVTADGGSGVLGTYTGKYHLDP